MKILHTADWHVGRRIRGRSRADEHRDVLREITSIADERRVDLVIVAGDLFDTASPTAEAEGIVFRSLLDLVEAGKRVVLVSGNHDNPHRLAAVRPLLDLAEVTTGAFLAPPDQGGVVDVRCASGEVARIALFPFQSQRSIVRAEDLMDAEAAEHGQKYDGRCRYILRALTRGFGADTVNIVVAHLAVVGGEAGGGERGAHTIFDYQVSAQAFPASAHYVALGHLHKAAQKIPGACPIWYSGSPLQLDFGDGDERKSVLIVDADPARPARVEAVPLTSGRRLRTIRGALRQLEATSAEADDAFLRVIVEEERRPGLADEVREMLPNAVDVVVARAEESAHAPEAWSIESLHGSPSELLGRFLDEEGIEGGALLNLFGELMEEESAPEGATG